MPEIITTRNLTKRFGTLTAIDDLSLSVNQGEMFGLVGPDGAGKTTLIRMLTGLVKPDGGSASIMGLDLVHQTKKITNSIGYLSQRFSLYGDLTVDENIEFSAEINEVKSFRARRDELLDFTRLTQFRNRLADQLSGGMKQKLSLVCTLIHQPNILFLDEPTTGVDPVTRRDFWKILHELLSSGITIVMATPYLDEAERCHHVALLNRGQLLISDTPEQIRSRLRGSVVEIVCADVRPAFVRLRNRQDASSGIIRDVQAFGDRLNVVTGPVADPLADVSSILKEEHLIPKSIRLISPSLENIFIAYLEAPSLIQIDTSERHPS